MYAIFEIIYFRFYIFICITFKIYEIIKELFKKLLHFEIYKYII